MKRLIIIVSCIFLSQISSGQVMMFFTGDSLTNITSPLDLDSLFYWFAADVGVTDSLGGAIATDEGVGQWNDLSGNGYNVTATGGNGTRPIYKATGGPGGKPCIRFDGSNDFLVSNDVTWSADDVGMLVVCKFSNPTRNTDERIISQGNSSNFWQYTIFGGNTTASYALRLRKYNGGTLSNYTQYGNGAKESVWRLLSLGGSGSNVTWYKDGTSQTTTRSVQGTGDDTINNRNNCQLTIARDRLNGTSYASIEIAEIIVYHGSLTDANRQAIENYLNKKYDLY